MKTVLNKTHEPIRVPLDGRQVLHLEPHGRGQISDRAAESRSVHLLVGQGRIEVVTEDRPQPTARPWANPAHGVSTHGHHPPVRGKRRGDR